MTGSGTMRNGQQSAVATDIIALMDALKIPQAILAGFDPRRLRKLLRMRSSKWIVF